MMNDPAAIKGRDAAVKQEQSSILTAKTARQVHSRDIKLGGDEPYVVWARLHIDFRQPTHT